MIRRELLWVHDLAGTQAGAIGHGFFDLWTDDRLDQSETLGFEIAANNPKASLIEPDAMVRHRGRGFYVAEVEQRRRGNVTTISVEANALWYRLGHMTYVGSFVLSDATPAEGLAAILAGSGWSVGSITSTSSDTFSMEGQDRSRLALLREWSSVSGRFIVWNTVGRTVDLVDTRGTARGVAFRYGRNVTGVRRRIRPPEVTRLFPYGADGLTISGVNGGVPYVEDLSYFTDQGVDLDDPSPDGRTLREWYTRSAVFSDSAFVKQSDLLAAAEARLEALGGAQVTYELDVVDLSEITSLNEDTRVGDTVRVYDPDFGQDVRPIVTRYRRHYLQPWRNVLELETSPSPISTGSGATSRPSSSQQWIQFVGPVRATYAIRNDGDYVVARIPLRFVEGGRADFHLDLWATGVGAGTMVVTIIDTEDSDAQQFKQLRIPYTDGETVRALASWATENLSGSRVYAVRVTTEADGGPSGSNGIDIAPDAGADDLEATHEASWWIKAQGAVEETPTADDSVRFDYVSDAAQSWTVPDNVTEATFKLAGAGGDGGTGGGGGIVEFTAQVIPGTVYDIYAPSEGGTGAGEAPGGWPGGGDGGGGSGSSDGYGGGGYAAIIPAGLSLSSAVAVAPAGGGSGFDGAGYGQAPGGGGGFLAGGDGGERTAPGDGGGADGKGATQSAGGAGSNNGGFGQGGDGGDHDAFTEGGGGGGGGWYGGGGGGSGTYSGGGGGGGSGYLSPLIAATDILIADGANSGHGYVEISWEIPVDQ